jgi:hypothetical protein
LAADQALESLLELPLGAERQARVLERKGRIALLRRLPDEARALAERALLDLAPLGLPLVEAEARVSLGEALLALGDGRGALRSFIPAQGLFEREGFRRGLVKSTRGLARIALSSGDYRSAEARFRESLGHARGGLDLGGMCRAMVGLAEVSRRLADPRAEEFVLASERLAAEPSDLYRALLVRALLLAEAGQPERALALLEDVERETRRGRAGSRGAGELDPPSGAEAGAALRLSWRASLYAAEVWSHFGAGDRSFPGRAALTRGLEQVLLEVEDGEPSLLLPVEAHLAEQLAIGGERDRARVLTERALERWSREGAVAEEEAPLIFYAHARTLDHLGARRPELAAALRGAIEQVDLILSRLVAGQRERYLERRPIRAILRAAEGAGLTIHRDRKSARLTLSP